MAVPLRGPSSRGEDEEKRRRSVLDGGEAVISGVWRLRRGAGIGPAAAAFFMASVIVKPRSVIRRCFN